MKTRLDNLLLSANVIVCQTLIKISQQNSVTIFANQSSRRIRKKWTKNKNFLFKAQQKETFFL